MRQTREKEVEKENRDEINADKWHEVVDGFCNGGSVDLLHPTSIGR